MMLLAAAKALSTLTPANIWAAVSLVLAASGVKAGWLLFPSEPFAA